MMPPVVNQADAMTRRSLSWKNLGGIVTRWQTTPRGGFLLMPPPRKKKSSGSASSKAEKQQQPQVNPKILGIVGGIAVLAIVGYVAINQMSANNDAAQNAVNQPIARDNNPAPAANPPAANPNLPMAVPGGAQPNNAPAGNQMASSSASAQTPDGVDTSGMEVAAEVPPGVAPGRSVPPNAMPTTVPPTMPPVGLGSETKSSPGRSSGPSKNPLVSLIKGGLGASGLAGSGTSGADATLFITLEDGQHIPVTTQEHEAYFRGELQKIQIEKLISRSRNFSIDNGNFERIGASNASGNTLIAGQLDSNSLQSFLGVVTVKKNNGETVTATACLVHPDGGMIVPADVLKDGVDITVEFQNQKFNTSDIVMGYSDPNSRLTVLELPTQQQVAVVPIAQPAGAGIMGISITGGGSPVNVSLVSLENNKLQRQEVVAQPTTYQLLTGETTIPVPGNWLDVTGSSQTSLGKPMFDSSGALYGYTVAPSMDNPLGVVAVGAESIRPLTTVALTTGVKASAPATTPTGESFPGSTPSPGFTPSEMPSVPPAIPPSSGGGTKKPSLGSLSSDGPPSRGGNAGGAGSTQQGAVSSDGAPPVSPPPGVGSPSGASMSPGAGETPGAGSVTGLGAPGSGFAADQQTTDETARKVQQLIFAPSVANTKKGAELLTAIRWIQLGTLVKMNAGTTPPPTLLGRVMNTLGRQSLEKTDVNIATAEKAEQSAVLLCVINYRSQPSIDPTGLTTAATQQDTDMVFRLLAFAKDPKDPTGKSYLRVLEVEPMTIRVPSSFQEQGASRTMKEQITNMYNKFHSGIRKAKRDLGKS